MNGGTKNGLPGKMPPAFKKLREALAEFDVRKHGTESRYAGGRATIRPGYKEADIREGTAHRSKEPRTARVIEGRGEARRRGLHEPGARGGGGEQCAACVQELYRGVERAKRGGRAAVPRTEVPSTGPLWGLCSINVHRRLQRAPREDLLGHRLPCDEIADLLSVRCLPVVIGAIDEHKSVTFHEAKGVESRRGFEPAKPAVEATRGSMTQQKVEHQRSLPQFKSGPWRHSYLQGTSETACF